METIKESELQMKLSVLILSSTLPLHPTLSFLPSFKRKSLIQFILLTPLLFAGNKENFLEDVSKSLENLIFWREGATAQGYGSFKSARGAV